MALVALASAKGSPGVTTASTVLAALWPGPVLLAECDPAGSDLVVRMTGPGGIPLSADRGLVSLAAAGRKGIDDTVVMAHTQRLDGGLDALVSVRAPEQIGGMGGLWHPLGTALNAMRDVDVLADCGRIGPASPQLPVVDAARLVVLTCVATGSSVSHLRDRLSALSHHVDAELGVLVVADPKRRDAVKQVWSVLDRMSVPVRHRWHLAWDPAGAAFFEGGGVGRLDRTSLVRTAMEVVSDMAAVVAPRALEHHFDADQSTGQPARSPVGAHWGTGR